MPLDYATQQADEPRGLPFSWSSFAGATIWVAELLLILVLIVPKFSQIFVDFKLKLPALTQMLFDLSAFVSHLWILPIAFLLPIASGILGGQLLSRNQPPEIRAFRAIAVLWLFFILISVTVIIVVVALFVPMISFIKP